MVLDLDPESILQETNMEMVEYHLTQYVQQLAVLGAIEVARALMELFYKSSITGSYNHFLRPLSFAWKETGQWPDGIPEDRTTEAHLESERASYEEAFWGGCGLCMVPHELQTWDEKGLEACLDFSTGVNTFGVQPRASSTSEEEDGAAPSERLVKALDISLRLAALEQPLGAIVDQDVMIQRQETGIGISSLQMADNTDWVKVSSLDNRSAEILARIVRRWEKRDQVTALMRAERLWPLFITGVVADAMGLSRTEINAKAQSILDTFTTRMDAPFGGPALVGKPLRELLDIASEHSTRGKASERWFMQTGELGDDHDDRPTTLFKPAASEFVIAELEQRLGCTLPDDYTSFLRISNGFFYNENDGIFDGYGAGCALYDSDQVHWEEEDYWNLPLELLQIPREIEDLGDVKDDQGSFGFKTALPLIDHVLVIGRRDIYNLFLISPDQVAKAKKAYYTMHERGDSNQKRTIERAIDAFAGSRAAFDDIEWAVIHWASGGGPHMESFRSFQRYLETAASDSMKDMMKDE